MSLNDPIHFNRPFMTGLELAYIEQAHKAHVLAGDGIFTNRCSEWLQERFGCQRALITHSCTAALEMAALLLDIRPGDEVIMPSYTFVSTANAFVLRGATPVFVDIRPDTLNLDEGLVEAAVTARTRAIVPVHYAGVACEMDELMATAHSHGLAVVEDAAQSMGSSYKGRPLGSIGNFGALSFHETKNVISGQGGAFLVNDARHVERAEIMRDRGTDRRRFARGEVDKYTWQDIGSCFSPGELTTAFLWAQLENADAITAERRRLWGVYHEGLAILEQECRLRRPVTPPGRVHNGHLYHVLLPSDVSRAHVIERLAAQQIQAIFHYAPLHASPAGRRYGRTYGNLKVTEDIAARILRLPLWIGMTSSHQSRVLEALGTALR